MRLFLFYTHFYIRSLVLIFTLSHFYCTTYCQNGDVVNSTAVKEESEDRSVDHYNLRHPKELVKGKSLQHSLQLWQEINSAVGKIVRGENKNKDGERYTDVIFNGIGGSFLGPLMLVIAMRGDQFNFNSGIPMRLHFTSNTDPDSFHMLMEKLNLHTTIMVNMSKSGGTAETKCNMETFNKVLAQRGIQEIGWHNIAITTPGSKFDQFAQKSHFLHVFHMNNETGGRMSVVSAIGMVPCAFAQLPFDEFLQGQSHMDELNRRADTPLENPALLIAIAIDRLTKLHGHKNMIVLGYSDSLKEFAHYLQQLYMESLGKEFSLDGTPNPEGQTVFGGVGTGEQHAFMQQVQKGIPDCFVRFNHFLKRRHDFDDNDAGSMGRQLLGFVKGTEDALLKNGRPFISSTFLQCDMFNLGMMVALEERIVSLLAAFRTINAYDQPGVQDGKLSALEMNRVSKTIEKTLAQRLQSEGSSFQWSGDVVKAREDLLSDGQQCPIWFVDAVLSDIYANVAVPNSYPLLHGKLSADRKFEKKRFIYEFRSAN